MFDLHSIRLKNFRSYQGEHNFDFPTEPGLYFFTGETGTALGANGAGKSTLLDAITWGLYGRTTRGLKASEVLTWGKATCQVELKLTIGQNTLSVKRIQKPNTLTLNGKPVDQAELEKHLRLNYEAFLHSVINAQFGASFLALLPASKLGLFSDLLELNFWLQKSEEASDLTIKQELKIQAKQQLLAKQSGQLSSCLDDIKNLKIEISNFEKSRGIKLASFKQENTALAKLIFTLSGKFVKLVNRKDNIKAELIGLEKKIAELTKMRDARLEGISHKTKEKKKLQSDKTAFEDKLNKFTSSNWCPMCGQPVTPAHSLKHKLIIKRELENIKRNIAFNSDSMQQSMRDLIKTKNDLDSKIDLANALDEEVKSSLEEIAKLDVDLQIHQTASDKLVTQIEILKSDTNPYSSLLQTKKAIFTKLNEENLIITQEIGELESSAEATRFWIKGFKRLRLFLIEQAFRTLELEINNSLAQLGMPTWQVTFDIERENKSGGITKGFTTFVKSPDMTEQVRWENWSGGETQRLQLAGDLGLANLIMVQLGLTNTIEFWDEPSTHLSPEGLADLATLLNERAISEKKRIWIVDHTAMTNFGDFKGIITARKVNNVSNLNYIPS
jgi:DNA repair exonuclease SbcCD ATPase subunit